jgi:hypothetical protein
MDVNDYLLDASDRNWPALLTDWNWILPARFTLWLANRYGDLFLIPEDGSVCMLDVGAGTFKRLADDRDEFAALLRQPGNAGEWLMIPLVDACVAAGLKLPPGHCYGYKKPPVLGGDYTVENTEVVDLSQHYSVLGQLHAQIWELPEPAAGDETG